jgi:hypothetical protein
MAITYPVGSARGAGADFFSGLISVNVPANSVYVIGQGTFLVVPVANISVQVIDSQLTLGSNQILIAAGVGALIYSDGSMLCLANGTGGVLVGKLYQVK